MKAVLNHLEFEFKSVVRDKSLLLMNYLFPLAFYFMMALIMPSINKNFNKTMIQGMIVFTIMVSTLLGMPNPMVSFREKGIYRSYKIYGVDLKAILFIPVITTAIHITIVSLIIIITSVTIFHSTMPQNYLGFVISYFIILFSFLGLGTLLGVCSPNSRVTVLLAQLIFLPSMMLGGIMMPTEILSKNIQRISNVFPSTHSMNLFNTMAFNNKTFNNSTGSILTLICGGVLAFIFATYLFTWDTTYEKVNKKFFGILAILPYLISIFI
jgi:ABC-2 type transport system permease protein